MDPTTIGDGKGIKELLMVMLFLGGPFLLVGLLARLLGIQGSEEDEWDKWRRGLTTARERQRESHDPAHSRASAEGCDKPDDAGNNDTDTPAGCG